MDIQRQAVRQDPVTGSQEVIRTQEHLPTRAAVEARKATQANAYVWYIVGVIEVLLAMRLVFLLLGAQDTGFTNLIYTITHPLVSLFQGIFPSPGTNAGYFDVATLLAMVVIFLIGWGIAALVNISKRPQP